MGARYDQYRVKVGDDLGNPEFWNNPRFKDLDNRLNTLEAQKTSLDDVINEGRIIFRERVDDVLIPLVQEVNEIAQVGVMLRATSHSQIEISNGGKTLWIDQEVKDRFAAPAFVSIVSNNDGTGGYVLLASVVSYDIDSGALVVDVRDHVGSGFWSDWSISVGTLTDTAEDAKAAVQAASDALQSRTAAAISAQTSHDDAGVSSAAAAQSVAANSQVQSAVSTVTTARDAAASSADRAHTSELNAQTSETNASASATSASTSKNSASGSAISASTSASNAATSETKAKTSETNAKTSETNAKTSETNAKTSETNAAASASVASTARDDTVTAINQWNTSVLPPSETAPSTRPGGGALHVGDQYFKPSQGYWYTWDGSQWTVNAVPSGTEVASVFGRTGPVNAQTGDYRADQISRTPAQQTVVSGATVEATLETLNTGLAGKANTVHTHAVSDVTGLQSALDGKAATVHTHAISDVTGLQPALDAKLDDSQAGAGGLAVLGAADAAAVRSAAGLGSFATKSSILANEVQRNSTQQGVIAGADMESALETVNTRVANVETSKLDKSTVSTFAQSNLINAADAATARTKLGLSALATQDPNSVSITGGNVGASVIHDDGSW